MIRQQQRFRFALCADDYAMTPGVSRGILSALAAGSLTATSVMTTSPWWQDSAAALADFADQADIGLHLNLTLGAPLGPMPILAPVGVLPGLGRLVGQSRLGTLPLEEVADEIGRQCDRFESVFGRPPDHVDGHQHVQILAPIRRLVFAAMKARGWRPWLRDSGDRADRILRRRSTLKKALGLAALAYGVRSDAEENGFTVNNGFSGFSAFRAADDYATAFDRFLVAPGRAHLIMCHPGFVDDDLRRLDPVVQTRERELAFLTSTRFDEVLARHGASLARLSDLLASAPMDASAGRSKLRFF